MPAMAAHPIEVVSTPGRGPVLRHLDPVALLRNLWRHRELVSRLTVQEVAQRYRGSYLGILWSVITPLLMLAAYAFVFSVVFDVRWGPGPSRGRPGEFALTLFAGLIAFNVFA